MEEQFYKFKIIECFLSRVLIFLFQNNIYLFINTKISEKGKKKPLKYENFYSSFYFAKIIIIINYQKKKTAVFSESRIPEMLV